MSLWDKIINQNKLDSSLIVELSDISYRSTNGKREKPRGFRDNIVDIGTMAFEENPPKTEITREMIKEYQKEQEKPYTDPATGDKFKYYPSTFKFDVANLAKPALKDDANLSKPADENDIQTYSTQISKLITDLSQKEKDYKKELKTLNDLEYTLNLGGVYVNNRAGVQRFVRYTAGQANALTRNIANTKTAITALETNIGKLNTDIENMRKLIQDAKLNIDENKAIISMTNKANADNIRLYQESLLSVNKNRLSIQQQGNESDADYIARMDAIGQEKYDTNLYEDKAKLQEIQKMKNNFKNIIRKDEIIENVIKSFTGDQIFMINKYFQMIEYTFLDKFGFNNANLSTKDIVDEITNILHKILNPPTEFEIETETFVPATGGEPVPVDVLKDDAGNNTNYEFGTENNSLYVKNTSNNNHAYFKIGIQKGRKIVFCSKGINGKDSFNEVKDNISSFTTKENKLSNIINSHLKIDAFAFEKIFKGVGKVVPFYELLETEYQLEPIQGIKGTKLVGTSTTRYGWGIQDPDVEIPTYSKFGNLVMLLNKLYYKNILSIKTNRHHAIDGLNSTKVSDTFVEIIMKLYYHEDVESLIKKLNTDEKNLLNSILYMAGLHKKIITDTNESLLNLKQKFKTAEGELLSGNNNPQVLAELKQILLKLFHLGALSKNSIKKYLSQFK